MTATIVGLLAVGHPTPARATHFRYGHITWRPLGGDEVAFRIQGAWRRVPGSCVHLATRLKTDCSGADGLPGIGDVVADVQGGSERGEGVRMRFDDRNDLDSVPIFFEVTTVDVAANWFFGVAVDTEGRNEIRHRYAGPGEYTAAISDCCRISADPLGPAIDQDPQNDHRNNGDKPYRVATRVVVAPENPTPPGGAMLPIVRCPVGPGATPCQFPVPASGLGPSDTLQFRLADAASAGDDDFEQPGHTSNGSPFAATVDSASGMFTWNTTGLQPDPDPNISTLYSTQVVVEDTGASSGSEPSRARSSVAFDFLIRIVPATAGSPPVFTDEGAICKTVRAAVVGVPQSLDIVATDPDGGAVTLTVVGLPPGSTTTPELPQTDRPVETKFTWTPTSEDIGSTSIIFVATDAAVDAGGTPVGSTTYCPVTFRVVRCDIDGDCEDGADCTKHKCHRALGCTHVVDETVCDLLRGPCKSVACEPSGAAGTGCVQHETCCDNCGDDDGDCRSDVEDDDCCENADAMLHTAPLYVSARPGAGRVRVQSYLHGGVTPAPTPFTVMLRKGGTSLVCAHVPAEAWGPAGPRRWRFHDPTGTQASGLTSIAMRWKGRTHRWKFDARAGLSRDKLPRGRWSMSVGSAGSCARAGRRPKACASPP